jgi:hypothetical protein
MKQTLIAAAAFSSVVAMMHGAKLGIAAPKISEANKNELGYLIHTVQSEYQSGTTEIQVLLPNQLENGKTYKVLYILPVEAGGGHRWGKALEEVRSHDVHNRHRLICVYPTFSHLPWYADHPTNLQIRQESYFVKVVVPFVERAYPACRDPQGRLLVGFSKSGWGAFSLLLRHPDVFGKAAAWDAPLDMDAPNRFGMEGIFATQENFLQYQITALLKRQADRVRNDTRLIHLGYDNFRNHHLAIERLMNDLQIPHVFRDGPERPHAWNSGWLSEAVQLLTQEVHDKVKGPN